MKKSFVTPIIARLARKAGIPIVVEPRYGYAAQITGKNGRKHYLKGQSLDINPLGASEIARDKAYSNFFLKRMGYPTIPGDAFFAPEWVKVTGVRRGPNEAYRYAVRLGFPVVVKPNSLSQGSGVWVVHNKREFVRAVSAICKKDRIFLVQRMVHGRDYRVVVLDKEVISAYERLPLSVVGNGRSTIGQLLAMKQRGFVRSGRDTVINSDDPRILAKLKRNGLDLGSIPDKGQAVQLLDNRNLSTGGDAVDVTEIIHPEWRNLCVNITRDMGLRYCGVDLMVHGDITHEPGKYVVIEVNSAPGLDHYASTGRKQKQIVDRMYLKVLKAIVK
jgi:D-alanine-D-alanine ligase-like ATP-grasp enzyme